MVIEPVISRINCLSYAPFRRPGQSPFVANIKISDINIREDLKLLKPLTSCVRTYATDQGLNTVPEIARELGFTVLQGIWIGRDHEQNLTQIRQGVALANRYPDVIKGLIVGNETLLRREQTRWQIAGYLKMANNGTQVPVTYADVWEFWEQNQELADYVDYVTIHILPYWEDHPVGIDKAVSHVLATYRQVQQIFPAKRLYIGETGWPSAGRMRGPAEPGAHEQARFVREFLAQAQASGLKDYNLIEAFDQPWKRQLEGAMGGAWGVVSASGDAKFNLSGALVNGENALARGALAGTLVGFLFGIVCAAVVPRDAPLHDRFVRLMFAGTTGFFAGLWLPAQADYLLQWNRSLLEWVAGLLVVGAGLVLISRLPWLKAHHRIGGVFSDRFSGLTIWSLCRLLILFGLALMLLLHAFDPRYRGYPTVLYVPGSAALIFAWLSGSGIAARGAFEETTLALGILILMPIAIINELPENHQSIGFAILATLVALSSLPWPSKARRSNRPD